MLKCILRNTQGYALRRRILSNFEQDGVPGNVSDILSLTLPGLTNINRTAMANHAVLSAYSNDSSYSAHYKVPSPYMP